MKDASHSHTQSDVFLIKWLYFKDPVVSRWTASQPASSYLSLWCIFFCPFFLSVFLHHSILAGLPLCLGACISVCLHFCLCPRSYGIVTKCWLHTWQAPLPACLAFWGLSSLKNPFTRLPLFFPPLTPVRLCLLFFPPISLGWACGALPLRSRTVCELKLLTFGLCRNHRASGCKVFQNSRSPHPSL